MASSSSIQLLNTMEWAKKLLFNRNFAIGDFMEPALTSANTVMQTIVGAPFAWRWNRIVTGFICVAGQQDYTVFNWAASKSVPLGWQTIDNFGNAQVVTTAGATGISTPTWSSTAGVQTTDGTVVWTNLGSLNTPVAQSYSLAWIEKASSFDLNDSKWYEMGPELCLGLDSVTGRPRNISAQSDDGQGNITFRVMPTPNKAYPVSVIIQQKPPVFSGVTQSWSPIPDEYSHIYNWGFLALMYMFADDGRFQMANQKFVAQLLGSNQGLTDTQINVFLNNWQALTGQPMAKQMAQQQGYQSRSV